MSSCTFFGHRDAPVALKDKLKNIIISLIEKEKVNEFYVGNHGNFDFMVGEILKELSKIYKINYSVVLAYIPIHNSQNKHDKNTLFPEEIEKSPKIFAINNRNKWMINHSDIVVTYVKHNLSGAGKFKTLAEKLNKKVINLAAGNPSFPAANEP